MSVTATFVRETRGDFDGDGRADLIWRDSGGAVAWWLMNGATVTGGGWHEGWGTAWSFVDSAPVWLGPPSDMLWSEPGEVGIWAWDSGVLRTGISAPVDAQWTIVGAGDLDGNGYADPVLRHADGTVAMWLGRPPWNTVSGLSRTGVVGLEWQIVDFADLDGDGREEIVWRHATTGEVYAWFMNGAAIASQRSIHTLDPAQWTLLAAADFDGDGKADFLWRHTSGDTWVWLLDGGTYLAGASVGTPGPEWTPQSVADFDGDGKADIVWRRTDGQVWLWKMNGLAVAAQSPIVNPGGTWEIVGP